MDLAPSRPDRRLHAPRPDRSMPSRFARRHRERPARAGHLGLVSRGPAGPRPDRRNLREPGSVRFSPEYLTSFDGSVHAPTPGPDAEFQHSSPRARRGPGGDRSSLLMSDADRPGSLCRRARRRRPGRRLAGRTAGGDGVAGGRAGAFARQRRVVEATGAGGPARWSSRQRAMASSFPLAVIAGRIAKEARPGRSRMTRGARDGRAAGGAGHHVRIARGRARSDRRDARRVREGDAPGGGDALVHQGRVSHERAAQYAGISRIAFIDALAAAKLPAFHVDVDEVMEEVEDARQAIRQHIAAGVPGEGGSPGDPAGWGPMTSRSPSR